MSVPIYLQQVLNGERARHLAELASLEKTVLGLQGDRENLEKGKGVFEERLEKLASAENKKQALAKAHKKGGKKH